MTDNEAIIRRGPATALPLHVPASTATYSAWIGEQDAAYLTAAGNEAQRRRQAVDDLFPFARRCNKCGGLMIHTRLRGYQCHTGCPQ